MVNCAIILAGGLGTRLKSVVPDVPKPMAPIAGRPFLEYQMDYWIEQGINQFILSLGYRYEDIQAHFGGSYRTASIEYVVEHSPLGTGGGFLLAAQALKSNSPFLLLNGDTYFEVNLSGLDRFATAHHADWCFSLFRANESGRYMGLEINSTDGKLMSFESGNQQIGRLANGGVYWINAESLKTLDVQIGQAYSLENEIFDQLNKNGQAIYGVECDGRFIDIGVPSDYAKAQTMLNL
jgi:D-glycero-alpha-D-manno-heptose 1-phosphate guanylyltransferase